MAILRKNHPTIVICGEPNSGKSSLINLLVRSEVFPLSIVRVEKPIKRLFHDNRERIVGTNHKGVRAMASATQLRKKPELFSDVAYFAPTEHYRGAEIIELQASEMEPFNDTALKIIKSASYFIWCSNATQAWRNTEQETIKSIERLTRKNAVLVLTRGDHLRTSEQQEKLLSRIKTDALFQKKFSDVVLVRSSSSSAGWKLSTEAWRATGVAQLAETLENIPHIDRPLPAALLDAYAVKEVAPLVLERPETTPSKTRIPLDLVAEHPTPPSVQFKVDLDAVKAASGFKSAFVFNLYQDTSVQQVIENDQGQTYVAIRDLAQVFRSLNPDPSDAFSVTMAEDKVWTLLKFSADIPDAVCALRLSRSSGNLGTVQRLWDALEFETK